MFVVLPPCTECNETLVYVRFEGQDADELICENCQIIFLNDEEEESLMVTNIQLGSPIKEIFDKHAQE